MFGFVIFAVTAVAIAFVVHQPARPAMAGVTNEGQLRFDMAHSIAANGGKV